MERKKDENGNRLVYKNWRVDLYRELMHYLSNCYLSIGKLTDKLKPQQKVRFLTGWYKIYSEVVKRYNLSVAHIFLTETGDCVHRRAILAFFLSAHTALGSYWIPRATQKRIGLPSTFEAETLAEMVFYAKARVWIPITDEPYANHVSILVNGVLPSKPVDPLAPFVE
uniref:Uncharacterized protein n=1 Tax=viral metagenome TaxID=1070528 RepID=A0A2V0RKR1_9ZZZZ